MQAARTPYGAGTVPSQTTRRSAAMVKSLSAIGSRNFPRFVTKLRFLAIWPSSISVNAAMMKIPSATIFPKEPGINDAR